MRYNADMKYTLIADSCCDLFSKDLNSAKIDFHVAPLTLILGEEEYVDDETLDTAVFLEKMKEFKGCPRSGCPSPETFAGLMRKGDNVIVITLSSKLSGTYASAMTAAEIVKKEFPNKKLFVLDSLTAAAGLNHMFIKLRDLIEKGNHSFDELTVKLTELRSQTRVRFLLQDFSTLIKNGRMSAAIGRILATAKIKLICGDDGQGEIRKYSMSLGTRRGLQAMAAMPAAAQVPVDMHIEITHVNNQDDASFLKGVLEKNFGFKSITVRGMRGVSSIYASDRGVVIAY